jgi:2-methylcitrate dehydratase PrpD
VLEGTYGLYAALLGDGEVVTERIGTDLGTRWMYPETTYKPFANGSWNHASMEGVAIIMRSAGIGYSDITRIDCELPPIGIAAVCEPRAMRLNPKTPYHLKFSLPYAVAMLAVNGHVHASDFNADILADARISDLASRVYCHPDDSLDPNVFPARVSLTTADGRTYSHFVVSQKGSPGNSLSEDEHLEKLTGAAEPYLRRDEAEQLFEVITSMWSAPSLGQLTQILAKASDESQADTP